MKKNCCRVEVAEDTEGKLVLVVWLDKRGRGLSGIMWLPKCQECLRNIVLKSATPRFSYVVRSSRKPFPFCSISSFRLSIRRSPSSDFNVLLDAELGQGLFDAKCCQAGGSVRVPTLPHDFAHYPQSLEEQVRKTIKGSMSTHAPLTCRYSTGRKHQTEPFWGVCLIPRSSATSLGCWAGPFGRTPAFSSLLWKGQRGPGHSRAAGTPHGCLRPQDNVHNAAVNSEKVTDWNVVSPPMLQRRAISQ